MSFTVNKKFSRVVLIPELGLISRDYTEDDVSVTLTAISLNSVSGGYAEVQILAKTSSGQEGITPYVFPYDGVADALQSAEEHLSAKLNS